MNVSGSAAQVSGLPVRVDSRSNAMRQHRRGVENSLAASSTRRGAVSCCQLETGSSAEGFVLHRSVLSYQPAPKNIRPARRAQELPLSKSIRGIACEAALGKGKQPLLERDRDMKITTSTVCAFVALSIQVCVGVLWCSSLQARDERPNILFIFTDDHAAHAISAYGSRINTTPNMDRLAQQGMLFRNCFVTNSICGPSRAVILTGKHSHINGFMTNGDRFDGSQQTFPKLLRKAGYQTAIFGKWHLRTEPTGFDAWEVLRGQGPYYNPTLRTPSGPVEHVGYTTDIITDRTLEWLKKGRDSSKPFMLMSQHKAPHRSWQPGPKHLTRYDGVDIPEPPTLFDDYSGRGRAAKQQKMTIAQHLTEGDLKLVTPKNLTEDQREQWDRAYGPKNKAFRDANLQGKELVRWKYQRYVKDYLRCVDSVDDNIGRLLEYLDESGLAENTVVIYSSDQGWYLGDHGWYDKRWMYEESLRMPLIVRWPGVVASGSENRDLTSNLDFASTFLDIAGAEIPADLQGRSLVPLLRGVAPIEWRQSIYYQYYEYPGAHSVRRHYGVRTEKYKLIHFYNLGEWEFYDLDRDPDELQNRYDDPAYAQVISTHREELDRLRERYQVPVDSRSILHKSNRVRVLIWDEQQPSQKKAYPNYLGNQIAAELAKNELLDVTSARFADPEFGLTNAAIERADVLVWWGHQKHGDVPDDKAAAIVRRIENGELAMITLHSAHWATPFRMAMESRAAQDALAALPAEERSKARVTFVGERIRRPPPASKRLALQTEYSRGADGVIEVSIETPNCCFPRCCHPAEPSTVRTLLPDHPIAVGIPASFVLPETEMYDEPFHVPAPDAVIFEEFWQDGEHFRSGALWDVGDGKVFYFRPGHETYKVFFEPMALKIVENAALWLGEGVRNRRGPHRG